MCLQEFTNITRVQVYLVIVKALKSYLSLEKYKAMCHYSSNVNIFNTMAYMFMPYIIVNRLDNYTAALNVREQFFCNNSIYYTPLVDQKK